MKLTGLFLGLILSLSLAACAAQPSVLVSGNNTCHPSQDLPSHKTMKKVPEQDTLLEDFFGLFALERKDHAKDIRDYNSLYKECVSPTVQP